jgi:outer membrane lipoprotein SlyB
VEGAELGEAEGNNEGEVEGVAEGEPLGNVVGATLGETEGPSLGAKDGTPVGDLEGDCDGSAVGLGIHVPHFTGHCSRTYECVAQWLAASAQNLLSRSRVSSAEEQNRIVGSMVGVDVGGTEGITVGEVVGSGSALHLPHRAGQPFSTTESLHCSLA